MPQPCHELVPEERADLFRVRPQGALCMFMINVSHALMRPMRTHWPACSVNDLKAWFRSQKYVVETLRSCFKNISSAFSMRYGMFGLSHSINFHRQYRINPGYDDSHIYPNECNGKHGVP
jgi:hypothetical protein